VTDLSELDLKTSDHDHLFDGLICYGTSRSEEMQMISHKKLRLAKELQDFVQLTVREVQLETTP
jgi:hypothetical protein